MIKADLKVLALSLVGDLDFHSKDKLTELLAALHTADVAVIDFSKVTFVDSTILGCLAALRKRLQENGGPGIVRIVDPSPSLLKILTICGLNKVFDVADARNVA